MPEFKHPRLTASFRVPDRPTVRQQLAYFSEAGLAQGRALFERLWLGAATMIEDWQCDFLPDPPTDLDAIDDPRATELLIWAGVQVERHMSALEELPKASSPPSSPA